MDGKERLLDNGQIQSMQQKIVYLEKKLDEMRMRPFTAAPKKARVWAITLPQRPKTERRNNDIYEDIITPRTQSRSRKTKHLNKIFKQQERQLSEHHYQYEELKKDLLKRWDQVLDGKSYENKDFGQSVYLRAKTVARSSQ